MPRLPGSALLLLALLSSLTLAAAGEPPPTQPPATPITVEVPSAVPGRATLRITDRFGMPISGVHADRIEIIEHLHGYPAVAALREYLDHSQRLRIVFVIDAAPTLSDAEFEIYRSAVRRTLTYLAPDDQAAIIYAAGRVQVSPAEDTWLAADAVGENGVAYRHQQYEMLEALDNRSTVPLASLVANAQRIAKRRDDLPNLVFVLGSSRARPGELQAETYDVMTSAAVLRAPHFTFAPASGPHIEALQSLARLSGGSFARVDDAESLARRMIDAVDRMRIHYEITYPPFDAKPPYSVGTEFRIHLADAMWIGSVWFEQGDVNQTPMMLESKPTHAAPTSDFAPLTMQEFFLTAFGTLIAWEALFALYARLAIRRNDDES